MTGLYDIEWVRERDVDMVLARELGESADFRNWFLTKIGWGHLSDARTNSVKLSVMTKTGESDIELHLERGEDAFIVLVEDKIDAVLQPDQDRRYGQRAAAYEAQCRTVLVAPRRYGGEDLAFDQTVTYEEVAEGMGTSGCSPFSIAVIECAKGEKNRWVLEANDSNTRFWRRYWSYCEDAAPELRMRKPGDKPSRSNFVYFRDADTPDGCVLVHKFADGHVDLRLKGAAHLLPQLRVALREHQPKGWQLERAEKSAVVRVRLSGGERLDFETDFDQQLGAVRVCVETCQAVLEWSLQPPVRAAIEAVLTSPGAAQE